MYRYAQSKLIGAAVKTGGAFFLGPRIITSGGAAGVILKGRFGMEVHNLHSCRPVVGALYKLHSSAVAYAQKKEYQEQHLQRLKAPGFKP